MIINETLFPVDCIDIVAELQEQLRINQIKLLQVINDTPNNVMVACPYHNGGQERRPSMGIKKDDGVCHCFACGQVVSLPELISYCFGDDSKIGAFGWQWLLKNFLTVDIEERQDIELDLDRDTSVGMLHTGGRGSDPYSNAVGFVSEEELDNYRYTHPYMYKRRLTDEIIELFDIGYDKATNCITFPIRDIDGNTLFVARRSVKTKYFNYPPGVEKPLYGLYELSKFWKGEYRVDEIPEKDIKPWISGGEVIVCESMLDALTCWVYGKFAVALNGLGNELQFKQLRELPCRKLILATDADSAGMKARDRIRKNIPNKIITEYVWDLNKAKDLNDMDKEMFENLEEIF